jgi:hypothetical protein
MLPKKELGVSGYPTIFLVNRDGKIIYAGAADDPNLQNSLTSGHPEQSCQAPPNLK